MKKILIPLSVLLLAVAADAQILLSGGLTYSQNFDTLATTAVTTVPWTDNSTIPGWYASRALPAPAAYTSYRVSGGELNNGSIWSFGTNGVGVITDRAFGSVSSGTPGTNAWGVRFRNDTGATLNNILVSYTAEQWRNGGNVNAQSMPFSYQVSASSLAGIISPMANDPAYTAFAALAFTTPTTGTSALALDGNAAANRTAFSNILLTGVTLNPNEELMLRWHDINDSGNDHGFGVDDFSVSFSVPEPSSALLGGLGLLALVLRRRK